MKRYPNILTLAFADADNLTRHLGGDDGLDLACARAWLDMDESVSQIDPYCL